MLEGHRDSNFGVFAPPLENKDVEVVMPVFFFPSLFLIFVLKKNITGEIKCQGTIKRRHFSTTWSKFGSKKGHPEKKKKNHDGQKSFFFFEFWF